MADFLSKQHIRADGPNSWSVDTSALKSETWDLSVRNPRAPIGAEARTPEAILAEIVALDTDTARVLERVRTLL